MNAPVWRSRSLAWANVACTAFYTNCTSNSQHIDPDAGLVVTDASGPPLVSREITLSVELSPTIATVAIARINHTHPIKPTSLQLRYGTDPQRLGESVALDVDAFEGGQLRTPLLGLEQDTDYHARVDVELPNESYQSEPVTFTTGALFNGLPTVSVRDIHPEAIYGGYTVACTGAGINTTWAFIFNSDGDHVWAYPLAGTAVETCSRARMSYDGRHMWVGNVNVQTTHGALLRVAIDGTGAAQTYELPGRHHDFAMLPNGHVVYIFQANGGSPIGADKHDLLMELDPETGASTQLYSEKANFGALLGDDIGHTNYVTYVPELSALSFSMRNIDTIGLVSYPEGKLLTTFGGKQTSFEAMQWSVQHGHHVFGDRLFVFSNHGPDGKTLDARVLGYEYDLSSSRARLVLEYVSGEGSITFGDVRRLPNGNLFITYSNSGIIHETSPLGELLREVRLEPIGYTEHRKSLYGAPPPYDTASN